MPYLEGFVQRLWASDPSTSYFLLCMLFVAIISLIIALISSQTIRHLGTNQRAYCCLLFFVQFFIPGFGSLVVILGHVALLSYRKTISPVHISTFKKPIFTAIKPIKVSAYSEGWSKIRLDMTHFSENERKQALITLSRGAKRDVNILYRQLVSDNMEELRICAFSLLEIQQNQIHDIIHQLLTLLEKNASDSVRFFYEKQLAHLYWELVYLNLGEVEFRQLILEKSRFYAEKALSHFTTDPTLWVLLARIAILSQEVTKTPLLLQKAQQYHAPRSSTYPYLAELSYKDRDFIAVKQYLSADTAFRHIIKLRKIVDFWCTPL